MGCTVDDDNDVQSKFSLNKNEVSEQSVYTFKSKFKEHMRIVQNKPGVNLFVYRI